jgi:hypothetical protein
MFRVNCTITCDFPLLVLKCFLILLDAAWNVMVSIIVFGCAFADFRIKTIYFTILSEANNPF